MTGAEVIQCLREGVDGRSAERPAIDPGYGDIVDAARHGMSGPAGTLPHLDRIQRSFGRHDVSGVRAHRDRAASEGARAMQAAAFTTGNDVAFDASPDLRVAAHEAAHVIQQRSALSIPGGIGTVGDPHERHADEVAARVEAGHSAEALLDRYAPGAHRGPTGALVQRIQLTYDDGPDSAGNTRAVLVALDAAGARATFYLVGKRVAQGDQWRLVFDIAKSGHWLGNHAFDWNDVKNDHVFLSGTPEDRAQKILQTEWAIRDALIQGRTEAQKTGAWKTIPEGRRTYIDDVIAHGTGRYRTPGFRSKPLTVDGDATLAAIASVNKVLAATGLRPLAVTEKSEFGFTVDGVNIDPKDWAPGRTKDEIESAVAGDLKKNDQSILLHSRIAATAEATPGIVQDIKNKHFSFDATPQGALGSQRPKAGFLGLSLSNPATAAEIAVARARFKAGMLNLGPFISGSVALGIFQLAQEAGNAEVLAFAAEIKATQVTTKEGDISMANWMNANPEWRLFTSFFESWMTKQPFPKVKGVTI